MMYDITQMWSTIWVIMVFREYLFNIYHVNVLINLSHLCIETDWSTRCHSKVKSEHISAVAREVLAQWEEFAALLAPDQFKVAKTEEIKKRHDRPFIQCRAMLEEWADSLDRKATNGSLIAVMLKMGMRRQANEIFEERLVKHVEIVSVNW